MASRIPGSAEAVQGESKKQAAKKQMASRPAKTFLAVQENARPAGKPAPRAEDWSAGFPEARRQSKENRKSKSRRSKWPAARGKDHWQTKKEPGRRENQRREPEIGQPDPRKRGNGRYA